MHSSQFGAPSPSEGVASSISIFILFSIEFYYWSQFLFQSPILPSFLSLQCPLCWQLCPSLTLYSFISLKYWMIKSCWRRLQDVKDSLRSVFWGAMWDGIEIRGVWRRECKSKWHLGNVYLSMLVAVSRKWASWAQIDGNEITSSSTSKKNW